MKKIKQQANLQEMPSNVLVADGYSGPSLPLEPKPQVVDFSLATDVSQPGDLSGLHAKQQLQWSPAALVILSAKIGIASSSSSSSPSMSSSDIVLDSASNIIYMQPIMPFSGLLYH